jgi:large conductance mechanosensitive channel
MQIYLIAIVCVKTPNFAPSYSFLNLNSQVTIIKKTNAMGFFKEFKEFASKGNFVDIATAFVMGAAFNKIVSSFTGGIVSPLISLLTGGVDFSKKQIVIRESSEVKDAAGVVSGQPELAIKWGELLTATIDFIIVAFAMFLVIKGINALKKKEEAAPAAPAEPSTTEKLLMEIRDSLKK